MNPPKALNAVRIVDGKVVVIRPGETDPCLASSGRTGFANPVLVSSNSALEIDPTDALFPLFELGKASSNVQLLKSVRRSTLLWRLERDSPDKVWKDLLKAQEVFEIRAAKASSFNIQRVLARFQCGMCQQRGFDKDGRPLVWIFAGLEEYSREYQSEEKQCVHFIDENIFRNSIFLFLTESVFGTFWSHSHHSHLSRIEYSHTLLVLAEYALRYRRQGVEDITVIVDSRGIAPLNFGKLPGPQTTMNTRAHVHDADSNTDLIPLIAFFYAQLYCT